MKKLIVLVLLLSTIGCSPCGFGVCGDSGGVSQEASLLPSSPLDKRNSEAARGIVNYVWEEPMADVVDVPPGLDPDGVYYRPAHRAVVEIRQGRWQHYE